MPLQGKHALITSSSRGIGRGIALKLAAHGARFPSPGLFVGGPGGSCEPTEQGFVGFPKSHGSVSRWIRMGE